LSVEFEDEDKARMLKKIIRLAGNILTLQTTLRNGKMRVPVTSNPGMRMFKIPLRWVEFSDTWQGLGAV